MGKKKTMLLVVLLMAVGFAAVSTTLYINGSTKINANQDDFNVYYSNALVNGVQDKSVITDDTHIAFTTELSTLGEQYVLDYEVTNGSKNYDAELEMVCTQGNEYLSVTNEFDDTTILKAKAKREGKLTLEVIKSNTGDDIEVTIECTINANAVERTSLGIENRSEIGVTATDENDVNLNAKAYEITGSDEIELLNSLVETGYIEDVSEVDALIEVESDDFENFATTTFDLSSIASEGDKVVILHFNEETNEWEYIGEETVDANGEVTADFTSYSPVAFVVVKEDGTLEVIKNISWSDEDNDETISLSDIITIGTENFYVISSDSENIKMMTMYNLYVGGVDNNGTITPYTNPTGIQDSKMLGGRSGPKIAEGVVAFNTLENITYEGSIAESHVIFYSDYLLKTYGIVNTATLITNEELEELGCSSANLTCSGAPSWVGATSYWTRSQQTNNYGGKYIWYVQGTGETSLYIETPHMARHGIRPVITISKDTLNNL